MKATIPKEIIEALREGDHKAFETVFITYFSRIRYFIRELVRSDEDAEELSQELFVRLWENRNSLDPERSFHSYLYILARNSAFNFLKHKLVESAYNDSQVPDGMEVSSDEILFAKEIALLIEMTVDRMPEQRQRIYRLSRVEGMSNVEIADQLQISRKTVENQLSLALKELRRIISLFLLFFV